MANKTKELLLEILSEESAPSLSTYSGNSAPFLQKGSELGESVERIPSPLEGEPVMSAVELGQGEGEGTRNLPGVIVGKVVFIDNQSQPLVNFPGNPSLNPVPARSTVHLEKSHLDQDVVLVFDQGDIRKPIIMGMLHSSDKKPSEKDKGEESWQKQPTNVDIDGERLTFTAKKEIVLKCGKASITLTKAGKILIRGAYLLSRSSGANRVKGGSVQLN